MDICLCVSILCPKYNECLRGAKSKQKGICTISDLSQVCNKNNGYKEFIKG